MYIFNEPDFFTIRQLDLENKLVLPTSRLYAQVSFQFNALYQDIRNALIDAHSFVATTAKQVYEHPVETLTAWYEQTKSTSIALYAQLQSYVQPINQHWQVKMNTGREKTIQYLQAFWDNPEQVTLATLDPVTRYVATSYESAEQDLQMFLDNPGQFMTTAFAPVTAYLASLTEAAKAAMISTYYALADLFSLLMSQPLATLKALYHNTLSALLDVYFEVISSLLVIS